MNKNIVSTISFFCAAMLCVGFAGCAVNNDNSDIYEILPSEVAVTNEASSPLVDVMQTEPSALDEDKFEQIHSDDIASPEVLSGTTVVNESVIFDLDVGDNKHSFIISMETFSIVELENDFTDRGLKITVSDGINEDTPYQVIEDYTYGALFQDYTVDDVNFDGYFDFYYVAIRGNANIYYTFWVWSPATEMFMKADEFDKISLPSFDSEAKVIRGFDRSSAASNTQTFYKYIDGILTCIRVMDMGYPDENNCQQLTVQDYIDGRLVEVFNKKTILLNNFSGEIYDEFFKWKDLNYQLAYFILIYM